jgi:hypothetical protein
VDGDIKLPLLMDTYSGVNSPVLMEARQIPDTDKLVKFKVCVVGCEIVVAAYEENATSREAG